MTTKFLILNASLGYYVSDTQFNPDINLAYKFDAKHQATSKIEFLNLEGFFVINQVYYNSLPVVNTNPPITDTTNNPIIPITATP